jgi:hypothetical protein
MIAKPFSDILPQMWMQGVQTKVIPLTSPNAMRMIGDPLLESASRFPLSCLLKKGSRQIHSTL